MLIDAPVSGGVPRAKTGQLAIMAGGDAAAIERAMPVLSAMGSQVLRMRRRGLRPGDEGAEQPRLRRRLPDRHRGAADRATFRSRSGGDGGRAERGDGDEQLDAEEVQAVRAVAQIRRRLHHGAAGKGSVDRAAGGAGDGDAGAAVGFVQGDGRRGAGDVRSGCGSYRDGAGVRSGWRIPSWAADGGRGGALPAYPRARGRNASASATCTRPTTAAPARSAMLRATRSTRV